MNKAYWDSLAPKHSSEIFSVMEHDRRGRIASAIERFASTRKTAVDLGCAVGYWLPLLAPVFRKVIAVDISGRYIQLAREANRHLTNIEYLRLDISSSRRRLPAFDFALCVNAMMMPSPLKRQKFLAAVYKGLRQKGILVLVVPSLESALLSEFMLAEINRKIGVSHREKIRDPARQLRLLRQGVVNLDKVPYKHYLREELEFLLKRQGFRLMEMDKLEYDWKTEIDSPPRWLRDPYPWDWFLVARKN